MPVTLQSGKCCDAVVILPATVGRPAVRSQLDGAALDSAVNRLTDDRKHCPS